MSRVVDVATDAVRIPVARATVARVADQVLRAEGIRDAALSIAFVTSRRIAALNWQHLRHRGPTDVISFAFAPVRDGAALEGDIYIAPEVARANAIADGTPVREELLRLVVHGVLHVVGHDHPEGEARYASPMWRRQESLLGAAMSREART
ncbi:MAG TPA: rRNA maturation RNase YbeY [Gemmatimonadaceae bacterium]|nr:rRNA maturation RNase YbeY [Gemmatimonadaceae bacterium]